MNKVQDATKEYLKKDIPDFDTGDTLIVSVLVREGNKERVQNFEEMEKDGWDCLLLVLV